MAPGLSQFPDFLSALEHDENLILTRYDSLGNVSFISKGVETLLGISQYDLIGESCYPLYPKKVSTYRRLHSNGSKVLFQCEFWAESSDAVFTIEKVSKKKNARSRRTKRKQQVKVTEELSPSLEIDFDDMEELDQATYMKDLIENAPMPLYSVRGDGAIRWANTAMLKLVGYEDHKDEYIGSSASKHHVDKVLCASMMQGLLRGKDLYEVPCLLQRRDGSSVNVVYNSNGYYDDDGHLQHTRCFPRDNTANIILQREKEISDKARLEEAELRAQTAQEASRVKSAFIATVSHEVRTPINGVIGMASLLNMTALSDEQQEYVDTIIASSNTLLSLVGNVLDVTKIESGKFDLNCSPFNLSQLVHSVCKGMEYKANEKGLKLTTSICSHLDGESFLGDAIRITQIFLNFLSNALKFTSEGSVECRVSCEEDAPVNAEAEGKRGADEAGVSRLLIEVVDTGIGIGDCSSLFSPFVQAARTVYTDYGGAGLGLSISKQLVTLMGGTVGIVSEGVNGRGTRVWAEIPLHRHACAVKPGQVTSLTESRTPVDQQPVPRVLIVDDNKVNRKILSHMLRNLAYGDVDQAEDGQQAVDAVKEAWKTGQPYDIIFMDFLMPVLDGWLATTAIRDFEKDACNNDSLSSKRRETRIMALTANVTVEDRQKSEACGMDNFLTKPLKVEVLDDVMKAWTDS